MTLEKLLIFGVGLAIVTALTLSATGVAEDRDARTDGYRDRVGDLVDRAQ